MTQLRRHLQEWGSMELVTMFTAELVGDAGTPLRLHPSTSGHGGSPVSDVPINSDSGR